MLGKPELRRASDKQSFIFVKIGYTLKNMAMSKGVSIGSIVTGCLLLLLTLISVISGRVVMINLTKPNAGVSIGLWGFYVSTVSFTSKTILRFA